MADYISREAFKGKYLCCGYLPEMLEKEFDEFPAADVEPVQRWILCKDRPPKECGRYQAVVESEAFPGSRYIDTLSYDKFGWRDGCCYVSGVSHWMPLPGMPEGEGDECKNRKSRGTSA